MVQIEIKEEYKAEVVGFNNSGLPLGERNDLHILAEMAHFNPGLKRFFKKLPSLKQLQDAKADAFVEANPISEEVKGKETGKEKTKEK